MVLSRCKNAAVEELYELIFQSGCHSNLVLKVRVRVYDLLVFIDNAGMTSFVHLGCYKSRP